MDERLTTLNGAAKAELLSETETGGKRERPCYGEDAIHDRIVPSRKRTREGAPGCGVKTAVSDKWTAGLRRRRGSVHPGCAIALPRVDSFPEDFPHVGQPVNTRQESRAIGLEPFGCSNPRRTLCGGGVGDRDTTIRTYLILQLSSCALGQWPLWGLRDKYPFFEAGESTAGAGGAPRRVVRSKNYLPPTPRRMARAEANGAPGLHP
jgi:hypothetical protein